MQQMHILQVVFPLLCIYFYVHIDLLMHYGKLMTTTAYG